MDAYSPDFLPTWLTNSDAREERHGDRDDAAGDEQALAELADRISAARSIV